MNGWWTQIWSLGRGANRLYCGIARTEEGFAVDVFEGDTCVESVVLGDRDAAVSKAAAFEQRYTRRRARQRRSPAVPRVVTH